MKGEGEGMGEKDDVDAAAGNDNDVATTIVDIRERAQAADESKLTMKVKPNFLSKPCLCISLKRMYICT